MKTIAITVLLTFLFGAPSGAQEDDSATELAARIDTMAELLANLEGDQEGVDELQQTLVDAEDEVSRRELESELEAAKAAQAELRRQLEVLATGFDEQTLEVEDSQFELSSELAELLRPIVVELQRATAESRRIEELRRELDQSSRRSEIANRAVGNVEDLRRAEPNPIVSDYLDERLGDWVVRRDELQTRRDALAHELESLLESRKSILGTIAETGGDFLGNRGRNLLLGLLVMLLVYVLMSGFERMMVRAWRDRRLALGHRLVLLVWRAASVALSVVALLVVFNAVGDWLLLGLGVILLLGLAWMAVKAMPVLLEQARLMLDLGAVREGEVVLLDGLLWEVRRIGMRAELVNPELGGGLRWLPLGRLLGETSRPIGVSERLFPTSIGDWVELIDGREGRVVEQNPCSVILKPPGGALTMIPVADWVAAAPRILSDGFRLELLFGLDYGLQEQAPLEIPRVMTAALEEELSELGEGLIELRVQLAEAGSSSLDFLVQLELGGELASQRGPVRRRALARLVSLSSERGWSIPFPQLTVHRPD